MSGHEELREGDSLQSSPRVSPIRKRKPLMTLPTIDSESSEEFALRTPRKPLQTKEAIGLRDSEAWSSPEAIRYDLKSDVSDHDKEIHVLNGEHGAVNDSEVPGDDWSSSSSGVNSEEGDEVFYPLDERALGRLPRRLRSGMRELQRTRMERRNQALAAGAIRIVTPSDTESIIGDDVGKENQHFKNDGISLLNSMSLNVDLHPPSRSSSTATASRVLKVINKSSNGSVVSPELSKPGQTPSFESTHWPESIIPMKHWQNESDRIGLTGSESIQDEPSILGLGQSIDLDQESQALLYPTAHRYSPDKQFNNSFRTKFLQRFGTSDKLARDSGNRSYLNRIFRRNTANRQFQTSPTPLHRTSDVQTMNAFYSFSANDAREARHQGQVSRQPSPTTPQGQSVGEMTFRGRMEGYQ
ncbi:MAG: hypothetical protein M4579_000318 [Chaenotheca gracillima]|nr:MAG: hypothetical protein M4579_000318 [Chaenotheca gracillima]